MVLSAKAARRDGMRMVGEAAELLGVTTETLRNWDRSGKLVPLRNPVTGYRYYLVSQLEEFLNEAIAGRERGH